MIYFYCTSWQFFQMIVKWRISPTTEQIMFTFSILLFHFYSHIPYGMWRIPKLKHFVLLRFLLTHPVWDVTMSGEFSPSAAPISTHTSRVGCDLPALHNIANRFYFYSHIPCGMWPILEAQGEQQYDFYSHIPCGMWLRGRKAGKIIWRFLLTHPVWDVTWTHGV